MSRLLEKTADGGELYFSHDTSEERFVLHYRQDVEPVIEYNKARQNDGTGGWSPTRELRHVARIPLGVLQQWIEKYGVDPTARGQEDLLRRLLNDPENKYLRVGTGRI